MIIYVVDTGWKYEGGMSEFASTSYIKAWKYARSLRIKGDYRLVEKNSWCSKYEYINIKLFGDD